MRKVLAMKIVCLCLIGLCLFPVQTHAQEEATNNKVEDLVERVAKLEGSEFLKMLRPGNDIDFLYDSVLGYGKHKIEKTPECIRELLGYEKMPVSFLHSYIFLGSALQDADGKTIGSWYERQDPPSLCKLAAVEKVLNINDTYDSNETEQGLYKARGAIESLIKNQFVNNLKTKKESIDLTPALEEARLALDSAISGFGLVKPSEAILKDSKAKLLASTQQVMDALAEIGSKSEQRQTPDLQAALQNEVEQKNDLKGKLNNAKDAINNAIRISKNGEPTLKTMERINRAYKTINYTGWKSDRLRFGLMAAQVNKLDGLSTSVVLHAYPAYRRFMPGRMDLTRRASFFFGVGTVAGANDAIETKGPVYSAGLGFDVADGFTILVGYSLYQKKGIGGTDFSQGESVQYGISLTSDLWKGLFKQ